MKLVATCKMTSGIEREVRSIVLISTSRIADRDWSRDCLFQATVRRGYVNCVIYVCDSKDRSGPPLVRDWVNVPLPSTLGGDELGIAYAAVETFFRSFALRYGDN
jgi:hypothetical protein